MVLGICSVVDTNRPISPKIAPIPILVFILVLSIGIGASLVTIIACYIEEKIFIDWPI